MSQGIVNAFTHIRKERDFQELLEMESAEKLELLKTQLKEAVSSAGTSRSEFTDFLRQRLGQLRRHLTFVV